MSLFKSVCVPFMFLLSLNVGHAQTFEESSASDMAEAEWVNAPDFNQYLAIFSQATLEAGRCTGSWECKYPTTQCVNNRCVKPNGDGNECNGSYNCKYPTSYCQNGRCVKPNGDGGECTGSWQCKWPYSSCRKGYCER